MPSIPSHHNVGDTGHAADHNAIVDTLEGHDQAINDLQSTTSGIFYVAGGNVSTINNATTIWAKVNLPTGDRTGAPDTFQVWHGSNKMFWLDNEGKPRAKNDDPTHVVSVVDSVTGQTANIQEWRVNGATVASLKADGTLAAPNVTPTAWTAMPLNTGIVDYSVGHFGHSPQYRAIGDEVLLRGLVGKSGGGVFTTDASPVTIGTLPVGMRPTQLTYASVSSTWSGPDLTSRLEVRPDGTIVISFRITDGYTPLWFALDNVRFSRL